MPLRVAMPKSVMKPTSEATLSTPPPARRRATPPMSASGRLTMTSSASRPEPNARKSRRKMPAIDGDAEEEERARRACSRSRTGRRTRRSSPRAASPRARCRARMSSIDAAEVAARDVRHDDDLPLHVLAGDQCSGRGPRGCSASTWSGTRAPDGVSTSVSRIASRSARAVAVVADHHVVGALALEHARRPSCPRRPSRWSRRARRMRRP